jgi:hypothetical protein
MPSFPESIISFKVFHRSGTCAADGPAIEPWPWHRTRKPCGFRQTTYPLRSPATITKPCSRPRRIPNPDSPYLLIQRQFEIPDGGECYIETHDEKYVGHFLLRRVEFTSKTLLIEFDRPRDNLISVTFDMTVSDFKKASRVVKIISQIKSGR